MLNNNNIIVHIGTKIHPRPQVTIYLVEETDLDYLCNICKQPLVEPFVTESCGHLLCSNCLDQLLRMNKTECPLCRKPDALKSADVFEYYQRKVNSLLVRCQNHEEGCKWKGELRCLFDHLDPNKKECKIACILDCDTYIHKSEMKEHVKYYCHKRPTTCEFCGYHNTYDVVAEQHYPLCFRFPIHCPHKCTEKRFERCQLQQHLSECPSQLVECPFSYIGCSVQLPRKEMAAHMLQQHNQVLEHAIDQTVAITPPPATASPRYLYNLPPVVFTMTGFLEKKHANEVWTSPPYYTHTGGYKFCLKVYANGYGSGKDTHVSVFVCLMRGEYDHMLEWPFEGIITIELCNWREDKNNVMATFAIDKAIQEDGTFTSHEIGEETIGNGSAVLMFIPQTDLTTDTEYLNHGDCLRFKVSKVVLCKMPSSQDLHGSVYEFTVTKFSKYNNSPYTSLPFFTHPQGYKLCLKVYANGESGRKSGCVSIFATLMRGEHDVLLEWPFTGDIMFELLNWKKDEGHYKKTLSIDANDGYYQTTRDYGRSRGFDFISHSSLQSDDDNVEYLHDDCMRLRVNVAIYSISLLQSKPSWQNSFTTSYSSKEFTYAEFSKRKRYNNRYFSPPFTICRRGYELCLQVYANGVYSGDGTHVSIYVTIMRGDNDDNLQWPFKGNIIIELLNWIKDSDHYEKKISIIKGGFFRVTKGLYGNSFGYHKFIDHTSLFHPSQNIKYLQNDCLRLQVNFTF